MIVGVLLAATDGFSFLQFSKDLSPSEEKLRQHIRCICEAQVRPIAATLWDTATFDKRFVQACKDMGPAGLQIKGFGETKGSTRG